MGLTGGASTRVEIAPTLITTNAIRDQVAADILAITQIGGATPLGTAIALAASTITGSANFNPDDNDDNVIQVINILSDFQPNSPSGGPHDFARSTAASAITSGIDRIDAEFLLIDPDSNFPAAETDPLTFAQTVVRGDEAGEVGHIGDITIPATLSPGFVVEIQSIDDYEPAIVAKIGVLVGPPDDDDDDFVPDDDDDDTGPAIPEPMTTTLGVLGAGALLLSVRRRRAA